MKRWEPLCAKPFSAHFLPDRPSGSAVWLLGFSLALLDPGVATE